MKSLVGVVLILTVAAATEWSSLPQWYKEPTVLQMEDADITSRITNGQAAAEAQFPYQVAMKIPTENGTAFCGGTLISEQFVLSAAHCCVAAIDDVEVILGSLQIFNTSEPNRVSMYVPFQGNIIAHENWSDQIVRNDICLLMLPEPVELTDYINIAVLPVNDLNNYEEDTVIASGWGRTSDQSTTVSPDLQFVELEVISNFACNIRYFGYIWAKHICTSGAGGKSTCNGDSGGPIVLKNSEGNSSTLVGITSFGISLGCQIGWPAVFTRVSKYISWIQDTINLFNNMQTQSTNNISG